MTDERPTWVDEARELAIRAFQGEILLVLHQVTVLLGAERPIGPQQPVYSAVGRARPFVRRRRPQP